LQQDATFAALFILDREKREDRDDMRDALEKTQQKERRYKGHHHQNKMTNLPESESF
jgi:thiamine phosphate synthase YjbQ (UPF0047 family)